jgi:thioredoxin-related protein
MKISTLKNVLLYMGIPVVFLFSFADGCFGSNQNVEGIKKDTLLVFTGSDWCLPCMRLEKNILSDSVFTNFITSTFIYIHADFPQKKKLNEVEVMRNEKLAESYNPDGKFPLIVVVKNGLPTPIPFHDQKTNELLTSLQFILNGHE